MAHKRYNPKDHFFRKAKQEGLRARSAFKIDEIAKRFPIFHRGQSVLDLGAAPGGFLQIIADAVGPKGEVVGVDLVAISPLGRHNVKTIVFDVLNAELDTKISELHPGTFDVVVSDLAPKTTGVHSTDEARSLELAGVALNLSKTRGKPNGNFVAKLFMGGDFGKFRDEVRSVFEEVKVVRPEATRGASKEVYLVGLKMKPS